MAVDHLRHGQGPFPHNCHFLSFVDHFLSFGDYFVSFADGHFLSLDHHCLDQYFCLWNKVIYEGGIDNLICDTNGKKD